MKTNSIRIVAGKYKNRKLRFPSIEGLRPTSDQMKETLFNWLTPFIHDSICIDAFAGSGSLGIEAISRGADKAIFYDINTKAIRQIKDNLDILSISNCEVRKLDASKALSTIETTDNYIIFLDPPFNKNIAKSALEIIANNAKIVEGTIIYLETEKSAELDLEAFEIIKEKNTSNISAKLIIKK